MQIKTFPHEFLARWGRDGRLQGYHVLTVDIACDDAGIPLKKDPTDPASENLMERFGAATTLERAGITLDGILSEVHAAALAEVDAVRVSMAAATAKEAATAENLAKMTDELAAAQESIAALQGALDAAIAGHAAQVAEIKSQPAP